MLDAKSQDLQLKKTQIDEPITEVQSVDSFDKMGLSTDLIRGIYGYGFVSPSVIQQRSIMPILSGKDIIAQAQSGTGKTGAFSISALQTVDPLSPNIQAMILSPTRELAKQTGVVIKALAEYMKLDITIFSGGTHVVEDIKKLKEGGTQVVVGTPGRVGELLRKQILRSEHLKLLIIDEADEMLDRGFKEQFAEILSKVPGDVQIALFSATMPEEILKVSAGFMRDPVRILVKNEELTLDGIRQFYLAMEKDSDKFTNFLEIYQNIEIQQCMMYCNSKKRVEELTEKLKQAGFVVSFMHGDMDQIQRDLVMREFRTGASRVLISTDLLARGIDIQQVSLVVNYDLPFKKEQYIHRIGRTGRFGRKGACINFVTPLDYKLLVEIEKFYNTEVKEIPTDLAEVYGDNQ